MRIIDMPSPNHDARNAPIDMLVMHYTGMENASFALSRLCDPHAKVSSHYTIDEDGTIYAHVPESRRAWHAGTSFWAGETNVNARSIGIELVNPGHEFGYHPFAQAQIVSLTALCQDILRRHAICRARVLAHSDVAPARKEDPGELFPWQRLAAAGIGLWPRPYGNSAAKDLAQFGYDLNVPQHKLISAFQRHFRPSNLNGIWDPECGAILGGLLAALHQDAD